MHLDILLSKKGTYSIGIAELRNENKLDTSNLLSLVQNKDESLLAVQLFNASMIVDVQHLLSASQNALNAWNGGYAMARALEVEIAVYASAQRQIGRALDSVGVSDELETVAIVVIGNDDLIVQNAIEDFKERIGPLSSAPFPADITRLQMLMDHYGIERREVDLMSREDDSEAIREALSKCVVSRVSMVSLDS